MSFILRLLTPRDFPSVDPLLTAAYARSTSMLDELTHYYRLQPDGWILALRNEKPVGMGGVLFYGSFARIGLMAVRALTNVWVRIIFRIWQSKTCYQSTLFEQAQ